MKHIDQLRADKIRIEHELEAESEAVMNRLTRELSNLRTRLETAGVPAPVENPTTAGPGSQTPRTPSRTPSRASSVSRGVSGANSPGYVTLKGELTLRSNPAILSISPGIVPIIAPVPRRDSTEMRGRAWSNTPTPFALNGETHGHERFIENLKFENADVKRAFRELDERCNSHSHFMWLTLDRYKQAECERQKEEIQYLKMEIQLLQRRVSIPENGVPSVATSINADGIAPLSVGHSNVATVGSPSTKKSITPEKKS